MSYQQLTLKQRFQLETLLETMQVHKHIAQWMDVNESTISRELNRNSENGKYEARHAHSLSFRRRKSAKSKSKKLLNNTTIHNYVKEKLKLYWSPEQIAGRGRKESGIIICYETIYQFIYEEKPEWKKYLRQKKGKYRRRHGTKAREKAREEAKKMRIDKRDAVVEKRERLGDWEGDTIVGGERHTGILTHVDRKSGYLLGDLFKQKRAEVIKEKTVKSFNNIPEDKKHTITYDNGLEFSQYEFIKRDTKMEIYFAYPYHSWERGTNENTNGLLRQFFPKKSMFATLKQKTVDNAVTLINHRPRKRLDYLTPYEVFIEGKVAVQARK
ncbi:MAG: Transposase [Candidatus Moranbacteria bacterium GW2011_GWF2_36_839]|nr:MAG: Transposase [Candidatus Moranbacteria bacterium GW2011_GWF1_36_78]KKQ17295.1 MAG: Transposase [Candidatus Moranbacteria bacterium GW2011_GWF2_36_839]HAT73861.1 IS30 family transposase [Candidatus Moranbacteria bacterium]HBY10996.1 IS30 family transposase [Candidatus Moranbacteria bacterium]